MRRLDRSAKLKDPLRLISCGNCRRLIDFIDSPAHPPADTPQDRLHPIFVKNPPGYSVLCSCGHYTFYVNESERANYEAKARQRSGSAAPEPASGEPGGGDRES